MKKTERTIWKNIRLTPEENAKIKRNAEATGVTTTDWIRAAALGKHIQTQVDLAALNELRRQGGLVKYLYTQGAPADATAAALATLEAVAAQLLEKGKPS